MDTLEVVHAVETAVDLQRAASWVLANPKGCGSPIGSIKAMRAESGEPMISLLVAKTVIMTCFPMGVK